MQIQRVSLTNCAEATGTVIVVDVLRAFTTAAYAFAAGAADITVVADVDQAYVLREANPGWLIMGEVGGLPVEGFDFGNSPAAFLDRDLSGTHLVQRTSSGTQGVVCSRDADQLLVASLCCASATVDYVRHGSVSKVTFMITGVHADGLSDEDMAGADYMEALLKGEEPDIDEIVRRVCMSRNGRKFTDPANPDFPPADLECAVDVDRFDFAMPVYRYPDRSVIQPASRSTRIPRHPNA